MKIVNPLYDKAFKYLMENNRLAKKVLEVILDTEIIELSLGQQETVVPDEKRGFTLFRLDFKALIKKPDGTQEKILIELQKSKFDTDIKRFRNYLGANYISLHEKESTNEEPDYPIITIYILGYNLNDLPYLAVTVNNHIIDASTKTTVEADSFFVKMLTHRSHILQVKRLPEIRKSRIEKFMTLFNQAWHSEKKYILDLEEIPEEFKDIAEYLQGPVLDEKFRRQLETEDEIDLIFDKKEAKYLKKLAEAEEKTEQERIAKERAEAKAVQERKEKERAEAKAEQERKEKERVLSKIKKMVKKLKQKGLSIKEIAEDLEISEQEIQNILNE